jgi:hypothetical protein
MTQLRAKQVFFANQGELLIGGTNNRGAYLAKGQAGTLLRVVNGGLTWTTLDQISSANAHNIVTATDGAGITLSVQNANNSAAVPLMKLASGATGDAALTITNDSNGLVLSASASTANADIWLKPQAGGEVIIGQTGGGVIQSDDNEDLTILGGAGAGNLFLMHGGTGKLFYAADASDPLREIATLGDVKNSVKNAAGRFEYAGNATSFVVPGSAVLNSVEIFVNGLILRTNEYSIDSTSRVITFDASKIGYTFDSLDNIVLLYNAA